MDIITRNLTNLTYNNWFPLARTFRLSLSEGLSLWPRMLYIIICVQYDA